MEVELCSQSAILLDPSRTAKVIMEDLELAARVCYKSEGRIQEGSAEKLIKSCIKRGHESVIEHETLTANILTSRAIANEIVRHRLASYSQESTRYVRYQDRIRCIIPSGFLEEDASECSKEYKKACQAAAETYKSLIDKGVSPQTARDVLPLGLRTELFMTANLRQWRHVFKLRLDKTAHPQIRKLFFQLYIQMLDFLPAIFEDVPIPDDLAQSPYRGQVYQEIMANRAT